jgi:hypothetical protein
MTQGRLAFAILAGAVTGLALAVWLLGPGVWAALLPQPAVAASLLAFAGRLATLRPFPTDLLALACLATIPLMALCDLAQAARTWRELRKIRREMGLGRG